MRHQRIVFVFLLLACLGVGQSKAQFAGTSAPNHIESKFLPRPPAGNPVAIVVFEDLGCPGCANAHPFERAAADATHVPLLRYDFPIPSHIWTFQGAVCARYLQDKVSPQLADQYRSDVFASQRLISNKDDLQAFTQRWMKKHGQPMPFVLDPDGKLAGEVKADYDLGLRVNVGFTPTVVVVTHDQYQVVCGSGTGTEDPAQIQTVVQAALTKTHAAPPPVSHSKKAKS